jgi:hypothetical protein
MAEKISITLFIDKEVWRRVRQELRDAGYPRGAPSWLAQRAFEQAIRELEEIGVATQLELFEGKKK